MVRVLWTSLPSCNSRTFEPNLTENGLRPDFAPETQLQQLGQPVWTFDQLGIRYRL